MPDYKIYTLKSTNQDFSEDIDNEYITEFIDVIKNILNYENITFKSIRMI